MPYIADGVALVASCASGSNMLSVVSTVVTADYMSRIAMDVVSHEFKENYVDPVLDYMQEVYACGVNYFNHSIEL